MKQIRKRSIFFIVLKVLFLQTFFYYTAKYGSLGYEIPFLLAGTALIFLNYFLIKDMISFRPYLFMIIFFFFSGFIVDSIFLKLGLIRLNLSYPPLWFPTLWMMFLGYYGDVFNRMQDFPIWLLCILGACGGTLAYYRGLSIGGIEIQGHFYIYVALIWAVFIPVTLRYFRYFKLKKITSS